MNLDLLNCPIHVWLVNPLAPKYPKMRPEKVKIVALPNPTTSYDYILKCFDTKVEKEYEKVKKL